jgi:hypothetical protein
MESKIDAVNKSPTGRSNAGRSFEDLKTKSRLREVSNAANEYTANEYCC